MMREAAASDRALVEQSATMLAAGHETTAVALFWSLYILAHLPAAQRRIAAEAGALDLGPAGAGNALSRLPYTRAVVDEALRLYPAGLFDHPPGAPPRQRRRYRDPAPRRRADRALGAAPPQETVARPRSVPAGTVSARRRTADAVFLSAVRGRPAGLHRGAIRADRSGAGAGPARAGVRDRAGRSASRFCRSR